MTNMILSTLHLNVSYLSGFFVVAVVGFFREVAGEGGSREVVSPFSFFSKWTVSLALLIQVQKEHEAFDALVIYLTAEG